MPKPKKATITPREAYAKMSDNEVVSRGQALVDNVDGNDHFPDPPIDLVQLAADLDIVLALIAAALDGSKKVIAEKNAQRYKVIRQMRMLTRYLEVASNGDMAIFRSSSLEPAYTTRRPTQHLSENIRRIERAGISGTLRLFLNAVPKAAHYQLRYAIAENIEIPSAWTTIPVTNVKSAIVVSGLLAGGTYAFQVRTLLDSGFTDWSASVTFMCT